MWSGGLSVWHVLIVVVAAIVLFGYKRLPDAARSIGRSARIFKAETQGLLGDDKQQQQVESARPDEQATKLQDQAAQLRAQAAKLEEAAKAAESQAAQTPKTS